MAGSIPVRARVSVTQTRPNSTTETLLKTVPDFAYGVLTPSIITTLCGISSLLNTHDFRGQPNQWVIADCHQCSDQQKNARLLRTCHPEPKAKERYLWT